MNLRSFHPVVLDRGDFAPKGHVSGHFSGCNNERGDAKGILWVETRDATKHPTVPRTAPKTELSVP